MNSLLQLEDRDRLLDEQSFLATVDILTGEQVLDVISDSGFLAKWEDLYKACPWGSVFQSKEFVCSWYRLYYPEFIPVIVKAESNGSLLGLLTLAIEDNKRLIMAAGLGAAEYQTWLALPSLGQTFITKTLTKLQALYPGYDIVLYNATPDTPLEWATADASWRERCQIKAHRRPLMDLRDPEVSKLFRKKQFREKTNRLKRLGILSFEKVTQLTHFNSILDELAAQSDFRKGAKFNFSEFSKGAARRQFLLELFDQGVLHTTILRLDNQIIASIAACADRGNVHLAGINTHSPVLSRYSPGTINFIMLGQLLMEEGVNIFDLTPGGDPYKERLATSHDYVHDIYVSSRFKTLLNQKIKGPLADFAKTYLKKYGIPPYVVKYYMAKTKLRAVLAIKRDPSNLLSWHYLKKGFSKRQQTVKCIPQQNGVKESFNFNSLQDLLQYDEQYGSVVRWDFLEDAMRRFEEGSNVYTITEDGKLIFCVWHSAQALNQPGISSNDIAYLEGIYCHEEASNRLKGFLNSVAREVKPDCTAVHCLIDQKFKSLLA